MASCCATPNGSTPTRARVSPLPAHYSRSRADSCLISPTRSTCQPSLPKGVPLESTLAGLSAAKMRLTTHDPRRSPMPTRQPFHCILPPDLLDRLARAGDEVVRNAAL